MTILADHVIDKIMMFVNRPVADSINEGLDIVDALDIRIIEDKTKMWFLDYHKEWCRQEQDENIMRHIVSNRLHKKLIAEDDINSLDYIFYHVNRDIIKNIIFDDYYSKRWT